MKNKRYPNEELGNRVRALRENAKLTQEELGEMLHYSGKYIADFERARRPISFEAAYKMAEIFNVDKRYLLEENFEFKTAEERIRAINSLRKKDTELMINAISSLAKLNGYEVEVRMWDNGEEKRNLTDIFSDMRECMVFKQNGERVLVLSYDKVIALGYNLTDGLTNSLNLLIAICK